MAHILLVDDDVPLRGILAKSLTYAGHTVIQAADGLQGVELARATTLDLVVTDLLMPVQEGVETIATLRHEHPQLPIIAISGGVTNSPLYLEIAEKIGANLILPKPFTPPELLQAIAGVLAKATPLRRPLVREDSQTPSEA